MENVFTVFNINLNRKRFRPESFAMTPKYISPEIKSHLHEKALTVKEQIEMFYSLDVWGLGCIFGELINNYTSYSLFNYRMVKDDEALLWKQRHSNLTTEVVDLLNNMLAPDMCKRYNTKQIIKDSFFKDYLFTTYLNTKIKSKPIKKSQKSNERGIT